MKPNQTILFICCVLFFAKSSSSQNCLNCGLDDNPWLSKIEASYLNDLLSEQRGAFDFQHKKIAFLSKSNRVYRMDKSTFFQELNLAEPSYQDGSSSNFFLIPLTEDEQNEQEGFHAFLLVWCADCPVLQVKKTWLESQRME